VKPPDRQLQRLVELMLAAPVRVTAIPADQAYERHVGDALLGLPAIDAAPDGAVVDVGSGGGVPGLVVAIARPQRPVTLVEATGRKAAFLVDAAAELGLENVAVVCARAEEHAAAALDTFAVATARALAPPNVAAELCLPYVAVGGRLVLYAGVLPDSFAAVVALLGGRVATVEGAPGADRRSIVIVEKVAPTPAGFPRGVGRAAKRPLPFT
jgi:16S rRNA (guanine527-N7)-methyltransferase